MQFKTKAACLATVMMLGATSMAFAQGGSTDRNGNANGSANVGSAGGVDMGRERGTTGMSGSRNQRPMAAPGEMRDGGMGNGSTSRDRR